MFGGNEDLQIKTELLAIYWRMLKKFIKIKTWENWTRKEKSKKSTNVKCSFVLSVMPKAQSLWLIRRYLVKCVQNSGSGSTISNSQTKFELMDQKLLKVSRQLKKWNKWSLIWVWKVKITKNVKVKKFQAIKVASRC